MATTVAKTLFMVAAVLFLIAGLLPTLRGQPLNTNSLSGAVVFLVLAVALRPRRKQPPPAI